MEPSVTQIAQLLCASLLTAKDDQEDADNNKFEGASVDRRNTVIATSSIATANESVRTAPQAVALPLNMGWKVGGDAG